MNGPRVQPTDEPLRSADAQLGATTEDGQFRSVDGAMVQCLTCRRSFPATSIDGNLVRRLEGASDPADMMMVVPVQCPFCGASGTLILRYGPEATAEDSDVLAALHRDHPLEGARGRLDDMGRGPGVPEVTPPPEG